MSQLTVFVRSQPNLFEDEEIYDIIQVKRPNDLLLNGENIYIVYNAEWRDGGYLMGQVTLLHGELQLDSGKRIKAGLLYGWDNNSSTKGKLDKKLLTPYLFSAWEKSGIRIFKIVQQTKVLAEYITFDEALKHLIPGRFLPRAFYYRKYNWITMMGLVIQKEQERAALQQRLCDILKRRIENLS